MKKWKCVIANCDSNWEKENPRLSSFGIPKNVEEKKKWEAVLKNRSTYIFDSSRVCENHFKTGDLEIVMSNVSY